MDAALASGVTDYLIWQWGKVVDEGYDILCGDPVLPMMRRNAAWLWYGHLPRQPAPQRAPAGDPARERGAADRLTTYP